MDPILPKVKIAKNHSLSKWFMKNGTAGEKDLAWGQESAEQVLSIAWAFSLILFIIITESIEHSCILTIFIDLFLRIFKIKTRYFLIPLFVWAGLILLLFMHNNSSPS